MDRIAIIGNAGSGKSYLAQELGAIHGVPVVDLDEMFWLRPGDYTSKRPVDELMALVHVERSKPQWVIEGVYGELIEPFLAQAQQLFWLDLPWEVSLARITARQQHRGRDFDATFNALVAYASAYWQRDDARSHRGHSRIFDRFAGTKGRLRSEEAVSRVLREMQDCR